MQTNLDILKDGIIEQSLPDLERISATPFEIYEDIYKGDQRKEEMSARTRRPVEEADTRGRRTARNSRRAPPQSRRDTMVGRSRNGSGRALGVVAPTAPTTPEESPELFAPKSFESYVEEKQKESKDIDLMGFRTNSLMNETLTGKMSKAIWSYYNQNYSDEEEQIEVGLTNPAELGFTKQKGREIAMGLIDEKLKEIGNVKLTEYKKVRQAKALWNKRYELQFQNLMEKKRLEADLPTLGEFVDSVSEDPTRFLQEMVQETINKPELIFLPQIAASRAMSAASAATTALKAGKTAQQVAVTAAGLGGAYAGGVTLGTIDRVLEQSSSDGEIQWARAAEQSQVDGILGMVFHGAGRVLTRGTSSNADHVRSIQEARVFKDELKSSTEVNLDTARSNSTKINEIIEEPSTETYIDSNGHVYNFEIKETLEIEGLEAQIKQMEAEKADYAGYKNVENVLKESIDSTQAKIKELKKEGITEGELTKLEIELKELKDLKETNKTPVDLAESWMLSTKKNPVITQNFMEFEDSSGVKHTLRRLTPDMLREGIVNIEGIVGMDLTGKFDVTKANDKVAHAWKNYVVSATSPLRNISKQSPTAKLLMDTLSPRDSETSVGRAPVYTIQENTAGRQGLYAVRIKDIMSLTRTIPDGEMLLRQHLRGVGESDNPVILAAAKATRDLLDDVRNYAKSAGMLVDEAEDFLPRYYNRKSLDTPEARSLLLERITSLKDKEGNPIYNASEITNSIRDIAENLDKVTDESARIKVGTTAVYPVGHRKWKDVPDALLDEFLEPDVLGTITRYVNNTVKRTELDRVFGYNGKKLDNWISQIASESSAIGRDMTDAEVASLRDVYHLLDGSYGGNAELKPLADTAIAAQNLLKLPLVTVTSALEPLTIVSKLHEGGQLKALLKSYGGNLVRGKETMRAIRREAEEVGLIHEAALKEKLEALTGEGLEGLPARVNTTVMKAFLLHNWTEHSRVVAYEASRNDIIKSAKGLLLNPDNKKAAGRRDFLARLNIHPDEAVQWIKNGALTTDPFYTTIKRGSYRFANEMIANPNKLNKSKLLSSNSSALRLIGQFKSFSSVFANEVVAGTIDEAKKSWNSGRRLEALKKLSGIFAAVSAMSYWTAYDNDILTLDGPIGDDTVGELATKMSLGVAGMLVPGASMVAPLYSGRGAGGLLGPTMSDVGAVGKELNSIVTKGEADPVGLAKRVAPLYTKTGVAIAESVK
ncbi:hypothetical protein [Pseudoalteromonas phage vB_PtuP_Slicky01]|nr:hypothetical protein [Pseudoalteromonas phage vB_PtuP_Slicky01]